MEASAPTTGGNHQPLDPSRHPAALSTTIERAWRPYRWRAYGAGIGAGLLVGGVIAPIATTSLLLGSTLAGVPAPTDLPWPEVLWSIAFALTVPAAGAAVFTRWQPEPLRKAAQTYIWLATQAEANWVRVFGAQPIPRDETGMRALLAALPETSETAGERFGLWIALLELDRARAAIAQMPQATPYDRFSLAAATWLTDFVAGTTHSLEAFDALAAAIEEPAQRLDAEVTIAVNRARVALSAGRDWRAPLIAVRDRLGTQPDALYKRLIWGPISRTLLICSVIGVTVYWLAMFELKP
jgi:hypothetical protein